MKRRITLELDFPLGPALGEFDDATLKANYRTVVKQIVKREFGVSVSVGFVRDELIASKLGEKA